MPHPFGRTIQPIAADHSLHADVTALIRKHLVPDTSERVLAVTSYIVGQVLAMQDQRTMTLERAWAIIHSNIEAGNQSVLAGLANPKGHA